MNRKLILCLVLAAAMCSTTWAWSGTVINVNSTNTTDVNGSTNWWDTAGWNYQPQWRYRTPYGLAEGEDLPLTATDTVSGNGDVFQSIDSGETGVDAMRLKSHPITLPDDNEYRIIYVFFWSDGGSPWRIRAGLSEAQCNTRLWIGGATPTGPTTPIQVGLDSGGRVLWAAIIAILKCTGQDIEIYTDDEPTDDSFERTWLDAYGYEAPFYPFIPGDLNWDYKVDFKDFAELGSGWPTIYGDDELADIADNWLVEYYP